MIIFLSDIIIYIYIYSNQNFSINLVYVNNISHVRFYKIYYKGKINNLSLTKRHNLNFFQLIKVLKL